MAKPKLRAMLDNFQGKDRKAERRKKMAKETEQRRQKQRERRQAEGVTEEASIPKGEISGKGGLQDQIKELLKGGVRDDELDWSTEDEEDDDEEEIISVSSLYHMLCPSVG